MPPGDAADPASAPDAAGSESGENPVYPAGEGPPDPATDLPEGSVDPSRSVWNRSAMRAATLCHPIRKGEMLLIEKQRGVGAGNLIAPGGKVEAGETPRECAVRETREETGLRVDRLEKVGELAFVFGEDPFHLVHVYVTESFGGRPRETEEGIPEWHSLAELPYDRMWVDDRYWLPYLLDREPFVGRFRFDAAADRLLAGEIETGVEF